MSSFDTVLRRVPAALFIVAGLALCAMAALGARSWMASHDVAMQLAATVAEQKQLIEQAATREDQRNDALAKTVAAISRAKAAVETPAQAVAEIPQALPSLPEPVTLEMAKPTPGNAPLPAVATVPEADLKPLYDYLQDCRACQAQLAVAQSDLTDERTKEAALSTECDAAVRAARGGGFWSRLRHGAKWFVIGSAVGAIAAAAAHH